MKLFTGVFWAFLLSLPFWVSFWINPVETIGFYLIVVGALYLLFLVIAILRMIQVAEQDYHKLKEKQ